MKYIGTSVIVEALDNRDLRQKRAQAFLENESNKIVSELVIVELSSILSRREKLVEHIKKITGIANYKLITIALIMYILRIYHLQYIGIEENTISLPSIGKINTVIAEALKLSHGIRLKTLIHYT